MSEEKGGNHMDKEVEEKIVKSLFELLAFENAASVLPMLVTETGDPNEPLLETIVCTSISGGRDFQANMPKRLTLRRRLSSGAEYIAEYTQKKGKENDTRT